MRKLTSAAIALLSACGPAGPRFSLTTDKATYDLEPDAGASVRPDLTNMSLLPISYEPCNTSSGMTRFGYSSLERQIDAIWTATGTLESVQGPGCGLKVGCTLPALPGPNFAHSNVSKLCSFELRLAPRDPPGKYRFVTTVRVGEVPEATFERVLSNTFDVRAPQ